MKQLIFFIHSFVSSHISLFRQCINNSAYLIYKWGPGISSLFMQSNLKTSVARVNPDTAEQPAGKKKKKKQILLISPLLFSALPLQLRKELSGYHLAQLSSLFCLHSAVSSLQPRQVPDDWLTTEADEWWNCWVASVGGGLHAACTLDFPNRPPAIS